MLRSEEPPILPRSQNGQRPGLWGPDSPSIGPSTSDEFIQVPLENPDGRLRLPSGPGLGIDFDLDYLRGNALDGFGG